MRGKRSKQYKKLMQQYGLTFGFREPYQVLVDADMLKDADRFKMDLIGGLERTLHGQVKPMITQCCMRHLYAASSEPGVSYVIDKAKMFERRRCDHRPEEYPEPLSAEACISSVVDPKGSKHNKHRYVVASQELDVRKSMRGVMGVPLVYINRSVMIMEPMAGLSTQTREKEERGKFRDGLKRGSGSQGMKRKRVDGDEKVSDAAGEQEGETAKKKKKLQGRGPKGPNPLAVRKSKKIVEGETPVASMKGSDKATKAENSTAEGTTDGDVKQKRRRKHKSSADAVGAGVTGNGDGVGDGDADN